MQAMSTKEFDHPSQSSRPFDQQRSGFILGEGAGIVVLEEYEHALQRNAKIYAEIIGYACRSDGYHLTRPLESGLGCLRTMQRSLAQSSVLPEQIDHINCHATSTATGDDQEIKAIQGLFQNHNNPKVTVTANKGQIGHCFGAAGSIETIFMIQSIKNKIVPFIKNLDNEIINSNINFVKNKPMEQDIKIALKNSFGFGGVNTCLLLKNLD